MAARGSDEWVGSHAVVQESIRQLMNLGSPAARGRYLEDRLLQNPHTWRGEISPALHKLLNIGTPAKKQEVARTLRLLPQTLLTHAALAAQVAPATQESHELFNASLNALTAIYSDDPSWGFDLRQNFRDDLLIYAVRAPSEVRLRLLLDLQDRIGIIQPEIMRHTLVNLLQSPSLRSLPDIKALLTAYYHNFLFHHPDQNFTANQ